MAYCNGRWVTGLKEGQMCPDGKTVATLSASGKPMSPETTTQSTTTGNIDTTPVPFGYDVGRYGSFPVREDKIVPLNEAMDYLNKIRGEGAKGGEQYKNFVRDLQQYNNSESTSDTGIERMWRNVLKDAAESGVNAFDLLQRGSLLGDQAGGGRGGGGYAGPTATTTLMNERDLRATADTVASTVLGRGISDEEFKKILKQVRTAERAEPTVTTPGVGTSVTQSGLSAQGRQDVIREALMKGPEAEDYGKATKMMDLFYQTLEARPEGG